MTILGTVLRVPLAAKLVSANLLVLAAASIVIYGFRGPQHDPRDMLTAATAMFVALALNVILVLVALKPIRDLERTAWQAWAGNLESRVPSSTIADADLDRVSRTLNLLLETLAQDRSRALSLASAVVQATDRERARVGHELHDCIAQSVAALRFQLMAIEQECRESDLAERLRAVRDEAGVVLEDVKLLSLSTHPRILSDLGLMPALRHLIRSLNEAPPIELRVSVVCETALASLPRELASVLYVVAQEAIDNAVRHASPTRVVLTIDMAEHAVVMHIDDDGCGFDLQTLEESQPTAGIYSMRERTALTNGVCEILSQPSKGTSVRVRIPTG